MEKSIFNLAEMANTADYAAMNYGELLETSLAFTMAIGLQIKPLLEEKRLDEMAKITHIFMTAINAYDATKSEIMTLLEAEGMKETRTFTHTQDVDDQTSIMNVDDNQDKGESVLALPEHCQSTTAEGAETMTIEVPTEEDLNMEDAARNNYEIEIPVDENTTCCPSSQENEIVQSNVESTSCEINVEDALEMFKKCPLPSYINVNAPYYIERSFVNNESLEARDSHGNNLEKNDLVEFRSASEKYVRLFLMKEVKMSTDEYLVYDEGKGFIKVRYYHIPEQTYEDAASSAPEGDSNNHISAIEEEDLKEKRRVLKKAIKQAKEMSFSNGTDANVPFYDRYTFHPFLNTAELDKGPERFIEDAATLSEIMPAFETFARHYNKKTVVLSKDNCVAAMVGRTIYLVLFNIPKSATQKKRGTKKRPESVIKEMFSPVENPLISKGVEMTKSLPVGDGTDANAPFFIQCEFSVIGDGELLPKGKPFSKNVSNEEELVKLRRNHMRFAKTMKAINPISTKDYTAYIWNEGRNLSVFYYNTRGLADTA